MCRIVGFVDNGYRGQYDIGGVLVRMRDLMSSGGPDDAGEYISKEKCLAMGHRRLSILDLSPMGHQPMEYDDLSITYNGEVYNFMEIGDELESYGYSFQSKSDTEVVLKALHKWGIQCVNKFRGMWSFALWDKKKETITLCRDRIGVKPLYWYQKNSLFMFASELKAFFEHPLFSKEIDKKALSLYFQLGYIPGPYSIFTHTNKMKPGYILEFDINSQRYTEKQYWDIKTYYLMGFEKETDMQNRSEEEIQTELEVLLEDSFKLRLISDVPVGLFLSGGIDSSLVAALLQKDMTSRLKTFTIGFHGDVCYDEAPTAKKIAEHLKTDHTEYYFSSEDVVNTIPAVPLLYDEPFGDSSALPTYLVSIMAKKHVTVALSADGGDELFCGYNLYAQPFVDRLNMAMKVITQKSFRNGIMKLFHNRVAENMLYAYYPTKYNLRGKLNRLLFLLKEIDFSEGWCLRDALMYIDAIRYLPDDILVKVDRATMGVSLEGREPFLDNRLIEYVCQMPIKFKYKNGVRKHMLKRIVSRYVPKEILEKPKRGFSIPLNSEPYRSKLNELFKYYLSDRLLKKTEIIDRNACKDLLQQWNSMRLSYEKLWYTLCFQMWAEKYLW